MVKVLPPLKVDIPEPPAGQVWHIAPAGHYLWLEDPEYYDEMGRDPLQQAKIWTIIDSDQRAEKFGEIVKKYPKQKHRRDMLYEAARRGDTVLARTVVQIGLKIHPDIQTTQEMEDKSNEEDQDEPGSTLDKDDLAVTPVHIAASLGHLTCVKMFIEEASVEVDVRDEFGRTPLIAAYNQLEVVRYLLAQGAEPRARTVGEGDRADTHATQYTGPNVLECAVGSNNVDVLKILLDHPSLNSANDWLTSLAIKNAARGGFESLKLVLERGGYPMGDRNDTTKANLLSEEQRQNIIEATPIAAEQGDLDSLKLLLSYQSLTNKYGYGYFPSFEVPETWYKPFIYGMYNSMVTNRPDKFEFLNDFGLKEHESMSLDKLPEDQNVNKQHLLEKAVESGSIDSANLIIIKYGAEPNQHRIPPGLQPLYIAALRDKTEMLQYLLDNYDIDIHLGNGRYLSGPTALWGAINLKSLGSIAILLQRGGPIDRIDEELRNVERPTTAILRGTWPAPGSRPMVFLETEEHTREYVEWARHTWQNLNPHYVRLELGPEDKEWINALQLRKGNEELRETGDTARESSEQDETDNNSLNNNLRKRMPPMPTFLDRETELRNDDDLIPEFKPYATAPGFSDRLAGNPEVF